MTRHPVKEKLYVFLLLFMAACGITDELAQTSDAPTQTADEPGLEEAAAEGCQTLRSLNLRTGPGEIYDPPVRLLPRNTALAPLAFSPTGFPSGQWLEVQVEGSGERGWVSAGSQFVSCGVDLAQLPLASSIPPTPEQATAVAAVTRTAPTQPPRVTNDAPGGTTADYAIGEVIVDDAFLFRIVVADTRAGRQDGDGIDHVEYYVSRDFEQVYFKRENDPGYCAFGGGAPDCATWTVQGGQNFWPGGGPEVQAGSYHVSILVFPSQPTFDGEVWNWDFDFDLSVP